MELYLQHLILSDLDDQEFGTNVLSALEFRMGKVIVKYTDYRLDREELFILKRKSFSTWSESLTHF